MNKNTKDIEALRKELEEAFDKAQNEQSTGLTIITEKGFDFIMDWITENFVPKSEHDEIKRGDLEEIMNKVYEGYRKDTAWHDFYFRGMEMMISGVKRYLIQQSLDKGEVE